MKISCCSANTNEPRATHKHRRQHTVLHDDIWMAHVCNPATVCGNVRTPCDLDALFWWNYHKTHCPTQHISHFSGTNSEPCRVHLSMLSCADPANATWVCNTTTNNVNDTPPTFQNDPLHHGHTSSDVRSTDAVREAWSTSVSRPSPRQPNCKRQKTHNAQFANMLPVVAAARSRNMVHSDHDVHNTCSDNTCICLTSLEHGRVQRNTHTRHVTQHV